MADRPPRPSVALYSPDRRRGGAGRITEAELREAYWVRWCGRLDKFCEIVRQTRLGVVVGERKWEATVVEAVAEVAAASGSDDSDDSDGLPALVMVDTTVDGAGTGEGEENEDDGRTPRSRLPVRCERLVLWQVPGSLFRTVTAMFLRGVLDRCQRVVLRNRELATRSPILRVALIRVFERTERPVVEVQRLASALPGGTPGTARSLEAAWAAREDASELSLKELLRMVVLLRALLRHMERPAMSWSDVALESGVILQTLRRYLKQYAGVTPTQLEPVAIPALVAALERQVVEAVR